MQLRDYPIKRRGMEIPGNVWITVRERGKRVPQHCRHEHNIWVDLGREYLARVIAANATFDDHFAEPPREFIQYMGVGIGGDSQVHPAAYTAPLNVDYPPGTTLGADGNKFSDEDLTVTTLERPVKINPVSPLWLEQVNHPPTFSNGSKTVRFDYKFDQPTINNVGPYTVVPLSEVGLFLSTADPDAGNVYDPLNPPSLIGVGRQTLVAYNTFCAIPKTVSFSLEVRWELRF